MKDTFAWIFQIYAAVAIAFASSLYGIWGLAGMHFEMISICLFLAVYVAITLQKMIRDNQKEERDTLIYRAIPWIGLVFAFVFTWRSLKTLPIDHWHLAQIITSFLFVISSVFVLAKTIRDQKEYQEKNEKY
jgi:hypothetical protein